MIASIVRLLRERLSNEDVRVITNDFGEQRGESGILSIRILSPTVGVDTAVRELVEYAILRDDLNRLIQIVATWRRDLGEELNNFLDSTENSIGFVNQNRKSNIPQENNSFIGREKEIIAISEEINTKAFRLITLTGVGGIGKTRLALRVAEKQTSQFKDGIWFIELGALQDGNLIPQIVMHLFGIGEQPNKLLNQTIIDLLSQKTMLLIIDNCEHILTECSLFVESILKECHNICIIATSREALRIPGERNWPLEPLSLPEIINTSIESNVIGDIPTFTIKERLSIDLEQITLKSEAIKLFCDRVIAKMPTFHLTPSNISDVIKLCNYLEGVPLAIELAAASIPPLGVHQLLSLLSDPFEFLTKGYRTSLPRQQTMLASIEWSYKLLSQSEQAVFRRLALFRGGWTLNSAEQICNASDMRPEIIIAALTSLFEKSLVINVEQQETVRYKMLNIIQDFAFRKLENTDELILIKKKHYEYFLDLAEKAALHFTGADQINWFQKIDQDYSNLRIALFNSYEANDFRSCFRFVIALGKYWDIRGYVKEGYEWVTRLLDKSNSCEDSQLVAATLIVASRLVFILSDYTNVFAFSYQALQIAQPVWNKQLIAQIFCNLAAAAQFQGDYEKAITYGEQGLALARSVNDNVTVTLLLTNFGDIAYRQGHPGIARSYHLESLAIGRTMGNIQAIALSLIALGNIDLLLGDLVSASKNYTESLLLRRRLEDKWGIAQLLNNLGMVLQYQGKYSEALQLHEESMALRKDLNDQEGIGYVLNSLGELFFLQREFVDATNYFMESLEVRRKIGNKQSISYSLCNLGRAFQQRENLPLANTAFEESLQLEYELNNIGGFTECLEGLAGIAVLQKQFLRSAVLFGAASILREKTGLPVSIIGQLSFTSSLSIAQQQLEPEQWKDKWLMGRAMEFDIVFDYALKK